VVPLEAFGESTQLNTSGVIVRNTDRHIWSTETTTGRLADSGATTVRVGGLNWEESVRVDREGWRTVGGGSTYRVSLSHDNETRTPFASAPATAEPVIGGHRVSVNATTEEFFVTAEPVETDNENASTNGPTNDTAVEISAPSTPANDEPVRVPARNESVTVGPIELLNQQDRLIAVEGSTVVVVAQKE